MLSTSTMATHLHGTDLRIPGAPRMSIGYTQRADVPIKELGKVLSEEVLDDDGLVRKCTIRIEPDNLVIHVKTLCHSPIRLTSPDGRIAMFTRWWAS